MGNKRTFLIWNYQWDFEDYNPLGLEIVKNELPGSQEIKVTNIAVACTSNILDTGEPCNFLCLIKSRPGESLQLPIKPSDVMQSDDPQDHIAVYNRDNIIYSNFFDLDGTFTDKMNVKLRLNQGEILYLVMIPWTPPNQNLNVVLDYEVQNLRG